MASIPHVYIDAIHHASASGDTCVCETVFTPVNNVRHRLFLDGPKNSTDPVYLYLGRIFLQLTDG